MYVFFFMLHIPPSSTLFPTRRSSDLSLWLAIGVSGTTALENMLLGIPMILMYKLSRITYSIAKQLIRDSLYIRIDRKSTRLNSSHQIISYAVFCLKKKNEHNRRIGDV